MPAIDNYATSYQGITAPYGGAQEVTPSDSADLTHVSRGIHIAGAGDLSVTMANGDTMTWRNLQVGHHPIRAARIRATGTTATGIVAAW